MLELLMVNKEVFVLWSMRGQFKGSEQLHFAVIGLKTVVGKQILEIWSKYIFIVLVVNTTNNGRSSKRNSKRLWFQPNTTTVAPSPPPAANAQWEAGSWESKLSPEVMKKPCRCCSWSPNSQVHLRGMRYPLSLGLSVETVRNLDFWLYLIVRRWSSLLSTKLTEGRLNRR